MQGICRVNAEYMQAFCCSELFIVHLCRIFAAQAFCCSELFIVHLCRIFAATNILLFRIIYCASLPHFCGN